MQIDEVTNYGAINSTPEMEGSSLIKVTLRNAADVPDKDSIALVREDYPDAESVQISERRIDGTTIVDVLYF